MFHYLQSLRVDGVTVYLEYRDTGLFHEPEFYVISSVLKRTKLIGSRYEGLLDIALDAYYRKRDYRSKQGLSTQIKHLGLDPSTIPVAIREGHGIYSIDGKPHVRSKRVGDWLWALDMVRRRVMVFRPATPEDIEAALDCRD